MVKATRYPLEGTSLLNPRTINKINDLLPNERKTYIQELIGTYEVRRNDIDKQARRLREEWIANQKNFFDDVISELQSMMDNELA